MSDSNAFRWTSAARTHVGLVRRVNEDMCFDQPEQGFWAVADGMGGHTLGDLASREVIEALSDVPPADDLSEVTQVAREKLQEVNGQLGMEAAKRHVQVIGSTVVALFARDRQASCLWAGDSRLYLYRNHRLTRITRDHSQVEELVAQGAISPAEAATHPFRHLITRAVGAADLLELDEQALEVQDGDMFLLCSDGLSNEVDESQISAALANGNCEQAAEVLIDLALKHGGRDNISVVVVRAEDSQNPDKTVINPVLL